MPAQYADPPSLDIIEARYWRIFEMLQADRPMGFGLGYISATSVINYMTKVECEADAREIDRAIRFVHAIDIEYVAFQSEKGDGKTGATKP